MQSRRFALPLALLALSLTSACTRPPAAPQALGGNWDVQQVGGASLGEGVSIHMSIDARSGEITGFTGCNDFTASLTSFGDTIAIGAPTEASGACASPAAATDETRFLGVLSSVARFARHGRSLQLLPREHGEALILLRNTDTPAEPAN